MARNTGHGFRGGSVDSRTQTHNSKNNRWVERNTKTGQFKNVKSDDKPFKGVAKEVDKMRK